MIVMVMIIDAVLSSSLSQLASRQATWRFFVAIMIITVMIIHRAGWAVTAKPSRIAILKRQQKLGCLNKP